MSELKGTCVSISFESMLLLPNQVLFLIELSKNVSKYVKQMPEYLTASNFSCSQRLFLEVKKLVGFQVLIFFSSLLFYKRFPFQQLSMILTILAHGIISCHTFQNRTNKKIHIIC